MEERNLKKYQIENNELLELNRKNINGLDYVLLLQNNAPNSFFIGRTNPDNEIELIANDCSSTAVLVEFLKDETTHTNLQYIADQLK